MTYFELLTKASEMLRDAGIEEYDNDAYLLLEHATGITKARYLMDKNTEVCEAAENSYLLMINQRMSRVPLQHITGSASFYGYTFKVNENVLTPRFDTEILVEAVLGRIEPGMRILDICTGSGCIILSVLKNAMEHGKNCQGEAVDISDKALEVARLNANELGCNVTFSRKDILRDEYLSGAYDIIISNPPYIASEVIPTLMEEVREHEPLIALDGGNDGLVFYRKIVEDAYEHINENGWLAFEIGYDQGMAVTSLMADKGYSNISLIKDYAGNDRVCVGQKI